MGMRSPAGRPVPAGKKGAPAPANPSSAGAQMARRPTLLTLAAVVVAVEALGLGVAGVLTAVDTADGRSSQASSGVALTILEFIAVIGIVWIAFGVARVRPWSRTPTVMIQAFTGVVAIYLLQAHRFDWGVPALLLALAGVAAVVAPASWRALTR
jgi:cytochrome bd-type quinol oxidase subunit 2